ncbi:hypothetical protein B5K08_14420 [Rhizobium leguminosarum bv. trifolii]|uniref:Immunity protein 8 of polymorphic toxin system n=1 Tax=Rhizobium leguminosarum bv. trifolii TaxID=386 RepID=A0A3E1BJ67_RHILT|nr:Imm8 family immunity protein [Rhizobium leguminosarum]RFB91510.1 hypothetical protein B5K08_14420 [Rhizobium leguminosarum bv. trifolii]RFB93135.1 hypothetical protein B5K10_14415 [Rhizobium leguminosarum bv. trifolii]
MVDTAHGIARRMIKLQISNIVAPDLPGDTWAIDLDAADGHEILDSHSVSFQIQFDVGPADRDWAEHFFVHVITPDGRGARGQKRKFVVLHEYSVSNLKQSLQTAVSACEKEDWEHSLVALRRRFLWEWDMPNG